MAWETEHRKLDLERVRAGVAALLGNPAKGTYFLAELAGPEPRVIGQLLITYEWSDWRNGNFWWLQSVYVLTEFRGKGVFRALFEHVHALAKACEERVCGLRLYMDAHNTAARRTYDRLGIKPTNYEVLEMDFATQSTVSKPIINNL